MSTLAHRIPRVVVGTSHLGTPLPRAFQSAAERARLFTLLDGFVDVGCTAFDLAASYMVGGTERLFGEWLASRGHRDRLFLISKGGHPYPLVRPHRLGARALTADLHASLRRLGVERLDLYFLHRDDATTPIAEIVETMAGSVRAGQIAAWGVSNWTHTRIESITAQAASSGAPAPAASSPHFSLVPWNRPPWRGSVSIAGERNREARAFYEARRLPVLAWSPLGGGFFVSGDAPTFSSRRHYGNPENLGRRARAIELGRLRGATGAQIALAYLFNQPFPVSASVAASTPQRMAMNVSAATLALSAQELRWLDSGEGPGPI